MNPTIIRELSLIVVLVLGVSSLFLIPRSLVGLEVYLNEKGCAIGTTKTFAIHEKVYYFEGYFKALQNIEKGEEILFDYGDQNPENIRNFPWLAF